MCSIVGRIEEPFGRGPRLRPVEACELSEDCEAARARRERVSGTDSAGSAVEAEGASAEEAEV